MIISNSCVFLQRSTYPRTAAAMAGAFPYKLFLKVPWPNEQLASSDFTLREEMKGRW